MHVYDLNRRLLKLSPDHPARAFLDAFVDCRRDCVGRELASACQAPLDQQWDSDIDGRTWRFSEFAYRYLCFDIELDGWLHAATCRTESETLFLESLPRLCTLLEECRAAANRDANDNIFPLIDQVNRLLDLWEKCITGRAISM